MLLLLKIILFAKLCSGALKGESDIHVVQISDKKANGCFTVETYKVDEESDSEIDELRIDNTFLNILQNAILKAKKTFKKISNNNRYIKRIVHDVYEENVENANLIIKFMNKLEDPKQHYLILSSLYEEVVMNNRFASPEASNLYSEIQKLLSQSGKLSEVEVRNMKMAKNVLTLGNKIIACNETNVGAEPKNLNLTNVDQLTSSFEQIYKTIEVNIMDNTRDILLYIKSFENFGLQDFALSIVKLLAENGKIDNANYVKLQNDIKVMRESVKFGKNSMDEKLNIEKTEEKSISQKIPESSAIQSVEKIIDEYSIEKCILKKIQEWKHKKVSADEILPYIRTFNDPKIQGQVIKIVLKIFNEGNQTNYPEGVLKIALEVKKLIDGDKNQKNKALFEELKSAIPEGIRWVIWEQVCLKTVYGSSSYMFAENDNSYFDGPSSARPVFAQRHSRPEAAEWKFELAENETFFIKNVYYGEYLYADNSFYEEYSNQRKCVTKRKQGGAESKWELSPSSDATKFTLRNVKFEEKIYNGHFYIANSRWGVATHNSSGELSWWSIENCSQLL